MQDKRGIKPSRENPEKRFRAERASKTGAAEGVRKSAGRLELWLDGNGSGGPRRVKRRDLGAKHRTLKTPARSNAYSAWTLAQLSTEENPQFLPATWNPTPQILDVGYQRSSAPSIPSPPSPPHRGHQRPRGSDRHEKVPQRAACHLPRGIFRDLASCNCREGSVRV